MKNDLSPVPFPSGKGCLLTKVNVLRGLQSAGAEYNKYIVPPKTEVDYEYCNL